jgi:hypothetical protein
VVEDRNRITAGGIASGIDFALRLAAKLRGEDYARALELMLEYDPQPPFRSGTPETAGAKVAREPGNRFFENAMGSWLPRHPILSTRSRVLRPSRSS